MQRNDNELHLPRKHQLAVVAIFIFSLLGLSTPAIAQRAEFQVNINLPSWAPYYEHANLVRYYYLPDIECYYDLRNREFIYMEDGEWMFGRSLPPIYSWFDLASCFVVALDTRVLEPWRHFHYYVAHYPRFYYRTVYKDIYRNNDRHLRGFNENERNVVFNSREEMDNHFAHPRNEARQERTESRQEGNVRVESRTPNKDVKINFPERRVEATHPAEPVNYYGREVGRPVRVQRNMKKAEEIKVRETRQVKQENEHRQR